jgi:HAD superfamily hydrolase (TIGR01549 family)
MRGSVSPIPAYDAVYAALRQSTEYAVEAFASDLPGFLARYRAAEAESLATPLLFDGAEDVLATVVAAGGRNFLVSHRDNQVRDLLRIEGIDQYFTAVVTADDGFARKPDPAAFLHLIAEYGLDPRRTVAVGDRPIDIEAGIAAGVDTVYFTLGPKDCPATRTITTLRELLSIVSAGDDDVVAGFLPPTTF